MRLLRIQVAQHKTVIYHPSFTDIRKRICCLLGMHEYETVVEYRSVGAKEELCLHCTKQRYSIPHPPAHHQKSAATA